MAVIANMDIVLGARTGKLDTGFAQAVRSTNQLESSISAIGAVGDAAFGQIGDMLQPMLQSIPGINAGLAVMKATIESMGSKRVDMPLANKGITPPVVVPPQLGASAAGASSELAGLGAMAGPVGIAVAGAFVAAATAAAGAAVAIGGVRAQMDEIDNVSDAAKRLGMSFADLASLRLGLGQSSGLDEGSIDNALQKMQLGLAEARSGSGELADTLSALGLNAGQLLEAGPVEALKQISVATAELKSPTDQLQVAYQLFGKQGAALVSALRDGPGAIEDAAEAARNLGLTLSQAQAEQVGAANDAWEQVYLIADGVFRQIAAEVAPVLQVIGEEILAVGGHFGRLADYIPPIVDGVVTVAGYLYDANEFAGVLGTTLRNIVTLNWDQLGEGIQSAFTFDTAEQWLAKVKAAREAAQDAAAAPATGDVDIAVFEQRAEAAKNAAEEIRRAEESRLQTARRQQELISDRIQSLNDEVNALRLGEQAARAMQLARDGASPDQINQIQMLERQKKSLQEYQDMAKRGAEIQKQFLSPQDNLRNQVAELEKLRQAGAIDKQTFDAAAMDAAKQTLKIEMEKATPAVAALERGSVEAFSAARQAEKDSNSQKKQETLLQSQLTILENIYKSLTGNPLAVVGA